MGMWDMPKIRRQRQETIRTLRARVSELEAQLAKLESSNSRILNALGAAVVGNKLTFRSKPFVNQTDDMVRLTVDMPIMALRDLQDAINH